MARRGFTLMEMLIVIIIVGILAALAFIPGYKSIEVSYWRASKDILNSIGAGEQTYRSDSSHGGNYLNNPTTDAEWNELFMLNPNIGSIPVTFTVTADNSVLPKKFTATATRVGGPCTGWTTTIDQGGNIGGSATTPTGPTGPCP